MKRKRLMSLCLCTAVLSFSVLVFASTVPDTGQTKCYNNTGEIPCPSPGEPFYGQDANYTINPMSYTKLDGSGNALPDSAGSWAMVRDNVTGLIWEVKTNKDGVKNYSDPHDADNTYTWYDSNPATNGGYAGTPGSGTDSEDFIKALNIANFGGFSDWRIPTVKELSDIVNYSIPSPGPTIDTGYFPNTQLEWYWSSTTNMGNFNYAWLVDFYSGFVGYSYNGGSIYKSDRVYVRAVRGGQSQSAYVDNGDGTVTDKSTGLMWQKLSSSYKTWEQALSYCEGLNLGSHTDWRQPTIKELRSLVDYSRMPAINITYFPDTAAKLWYWSSTVAAGNTNSAYGLLFSDGNGGHDTKDVNAYVRAVRGGNVSTPTECTATIDENLLLHIPYLSYVNPILETLSLWADFVYEFNPTHLTLIPFKLTNAAVINNPSFSCTTSTLSADFKIHIPDVLFPDGITRLWLDLDYSPALSTEANAYWVVSDYGVISD